MRRHVLLFLSLFALACDKSEDSGSGDEENSSETGGGAAIECGEVTCASDEHCNWLDNKCGTVPDTPECQPNADDCSSGNPVCGCDGEVYQSVCEANAAGTDLGEFTCEPPAEMFGCGTNLCSLDTQFCRHVPDDGFAPWATWTCLPTPSECADDWSCACVQPFTDPEMDCSCTEGGDLGVRVSCSPSA